MNKKAMYWYAQIFIDITGVELKNQLHSLLFVTNSSSEVGGGLRLVYRR